MKLKYTLLATIALILGGTNFAQASDTSSTLPHTPEPLYYKGEKRTPGETLYTVPSKQERASIRAMHKVLEEHEQRTSEFQSPEQQKSWLETWFGWLWSVSE